MVSMLDLERFRATPLTREPFEFLIVPEFVKADARAKYKGVVEVVDDVRSAGVDQVGLLTEQKRDANKPPQ